MDELTKAEQTTLAILDAAILLLYKGLIQIRRDLGLPIPQHLEVYTNERA